MEYSAVRFADGSIAYCTEQAVDQRKRAHAVINRAGDFDASIRPIFLEDGLILGPSNGRNSLGLLAHVFFFC